MPLKKCSSDGKSGWKWVDNGHCYTGPNAKKDAIKQGIKIEGPKKFAEIMKTEGYSVEDLDIIKDAILCYNIAEVIKGK